jgi:DNA-binding LytR/AlgR family response regulator
LLIKADRKLYRLPLEELLYLQAYGDYVKIVCRNKVVTPKEKLSQLEQLLPEQHFLRVHRSYIIALDKVEYMEGNLVFIKGQPIPVAQANRELLLSKLA